MARGNIITSSMYRFNWFNGCLVPNIFIFSFAYLRFIFYGYRWILYRLVTWGDYNLLALCLFCPPQLCKLHRTALHRERLLPKSCSNVNAWKYPFWLKSVFVHSFNAKSKSHGNQLRIHSTNFSVNIEFHCLHFPGISRSRQLPSKRNCSHIFNESLYV